MADLAPFRQNGSRTTYPPNRMQFHQHTLPNGLTILGDGHPVFVLEPNHLA